MDENRTCHRTMSDKLSEIIEQEIEAVTKRRFEHPDSLSMWGRAYWDGNIAALRWVLEKIQTSGEKANE